jgi:UDP-N-acetylglucosamine acyltransferase
LIHPTAIVSKNAEIDESVHIGPYCIVEDKVKIRKNTKLLMHVVVQGNTEIGENCVISPFASIGGPPQDIT